MPDSRRNVLVLCTGNSARSILAEALLGRIGTGRFAAFSAGSHPRGAVHPIALEVLRAHGHAIGHLRSKSWNEFAAADAPKLDCVITVCDDAAGETCPIWPGAPLVAHWGLPDPAREETPDAQRAAFERTYESLEKGFRALMALRLDTGDRAGIQCELAKIGTMIGSDSGR